MAQNVTNVAGNFYDKYHSRNPIARLLMRRFLAAFDDLVQHTGARNAYEVGCGEGFLSLRLLQRGLKVRGSDLEPGIVAQANKEAARQGHGVPFTSRSIYELTPAEVSAELLVCCEVLEHVPHPCHALETLATLANPYVVVSAPREPLWRGLNILRGAYLSQWGNTPGHLQHWSASKFVRLVGDHFHIMEVRLPLPWTMVLGRRPG